MKKRTIWLIISLMSLALIGLTSFQLYWINSAIKLNRERFERDVHESMNLVVDKLEKQEALLFTTRGINRFYLREDSSHSSVENGNMTRKLAKIELPSDSTIHYGFDQPADDELEPSILKFHAKIKETYVNQNGDTGTYQKLTNKSELITIVLDEIITGPKKIKKRVEVKMIDSLLHEEFANKGIHLKYGFGVFDDTSNHPVILHQVNDLNELRNSELKAALFPNDILGNANYLVVNFPNDKQYLFKQIWATLASSVLFIVVIIGCFVYAILIIIKQKKLSEVKNDFINNMTHEFKTPISTVSLACEALSEKEISNNPDTYQRYLSVIKVENDRLAHQVEKVLQIAALDKQDYEFKLEKIDVHQILDNAIDHFGLQLDKLGGKIQTSFNAENSMVLADKDHLLNSFNNLLDNAIKYSGENIEVNVTTSSTENKLSITISDKGIGMTKAQGKKIFDKFYRVSKGNQHDVKGFGLGLNYVKSIIEVFNGHIEVKSELQKGSEFSINLPLI